VDCLVTSIAVAAFCAATLPSVQRSAYQSRSLADVDCLTSSFFLVDYVLRVATTQRRTEYVLKLAHIADFGSFAPYFMNRIAVAARGDLRPPTRPDVAGRSAVIRVYRLVRLFKLVGVSAKASGNVTIVLASIRDSADMLLAMLFILLIAMVLFSTLMYYAELPSPGKLHMGNVVNPSLQLPAFASIPHTFWWCIVTMLTVGYGDMVPITPLGQLVAGLCMLTSFIVLALPISVVGANFTHQWLLRRDTQLLRRRTLQCGAQFAGLKSDFGVHTAMLDNVLTAVASRGAAMAARCDQLRELARKAGVDVAYNTAGTAPTSPVGVDDHSGAGGGAGGMVSHGSAISLSSLEGGHGGSPDGPSAGPGATAGMHLRSLDAPLPPLADRDAVPRPELVALERRMETLLDEIQGDAAEAAETFSMAELVSSDEFSSKCDEVLSKHARLTLAMESASVALGGVKELLAMLAAERQQRPGMLHVVKKANIPYIGAAAVAATTALIAQDPDTWPGGMPERGGGLQPSDVPHPPGPDSSRVDPDVLLHVAATSSQRGASGGGGVDDLREGSTSSFSRRWAAKLDRKASVEETEFKRLRDLAARSTPRPSQAGGVSLASASAASTPGAEGEGKAKASVLVAEALVALGHLARLQLGTPAQAELR
jgi:voltage-gated potassium channel Kch